MSVALAPLAVAPGFAVYALAVVVSAGSPAGSLLFVLEVAATSVGGAYVTTVVGGLPALLLLHAFRHVTPRALTCGGAALGLLAGWLASSVFPFPLLWAVGAVAGAFVGWWFARLYGQPRSSEAQPHAG